MTMHPRLKFIFTSFLICALALKPVIDFFWQDHYKALGGANPQSVAAVVFLVAGAALAGKWAFAQNTLPGKRQFGRLFLVLLGYMFSRALIIPEARVWMLKIACSLASIVVIPWLMATVEHSEKLRRQTTALTAIALALTILGAILQIWGVIPWHYIDTIYGVGDIGRLTGFYAHPLDFVRVVIWFQFFLTIALICGENLTFIFRCISWIAMAGLQFLLLRTTHRTSLLLSMFAVILAGCMTRRITRTVLALSAIFAGWLCWSFVPNAITFADVFSFQYFFEFQHLRDKYGRPYSHLTFGRGRAEIWAEHFRWISQFSWRDWIIGPRSMISSMETREPHNQLLDLLELFGLIGIVLVGMLIAQCWKQLKIQRYWRALLLLGLCWYAITSEPLGMPTMIWWAFLFAYFPKWAVLPALPPFDSNTQSEGSS